MIEAPAKGDKIRFTGLQLFLHLRGKPFIPYFFYHLIFFEPISKDLGIRSGTCSGIPLSDIHDLADLGERLSPDRDAPIALVINDLLSHTSLPEIRRQRHRPSV